MEINERCSVRWDKIGQKVMLLGEKEKKPTDTEFHFSSFFRVKSSASARALCFSSDPPRNKSAGGIPLFQGAYNHPMPITKFTVTSQQVNDNKNVHVQELTVSQVVQDPNIRCHVHMLCYQLIKSFTQAKQIKQTLWPKNIKQRTNPPSFCPKS